MKTAEATKKLDQITINQYTWKTDRMRYVACKILQCALEQKVFTSDDIVFDGLMKDDMNCIGMVFRVLSGQEIIGKTGRFRSTTKRIKANGRTVFEYQLLTRSLAEALYARSGGVGYIKKFHPELKLEY